MAASPSVAASPTSLSDDATDDEEEEAPVSSFYFWVLGKIHSRIAHCLHV
jgi:hypothetical protein